MKKFVTLTLALLLGVVAMAAQGGYVIDFAGEVDTWHPGSRPSATYRAYIYIPAEMSTRLVGNSIESISVCCYLGSGLKRSGSVFVAESDVDDVVASAAAEIEMLSYAEGAGVTPVFQEIALDTPYVIKQGQGFFLGYTVEDCSYQEDYPIAIDGGPATRFAGYADIITASGVETIDIGAETGCNLCIKAQTTGEIETLSDMCIVSDVSMGNFTLPVVAANREGEISMTLTNIGDNDLESIEYVIACDGAESKGGKAIDIRCGCSKHVTIAVPGFGEGRKQAEVRLTKFNESDAQASSEVSFIAIDPSLVSERRFVVEECTGIWSGYSPSGIVAMDYMQKHYPKEFIGIAVHCSDSFRVTDYNPILELADGIPSCIINRDPMYVSFPSDSQMDQDFKAWNRQKGAVDVSVEARLNDDYKIEATVSTTFAYSDRRDYRIALAVTEDGLVATQTNYYSGAGSKGPGDWGNKGSAVKWTFSNTARGIFDYPGIEGSLPHDIVKGETYTLTYEIPTTAITEIRNASVIAMVIDSETGTIMNAHKQTRIDLSGINEVESDGVILESGRGYIRVEGGEAEVYGLDGRRIATGSGTWRLAPGIYLVSLSGRTRKLTVR